MMDRKIRAHDLKLALDRFLANVERRALIMAELSTNSRDDAMDVVQEAMFAFARKYANKPEEEWRPLFYRVLQNKMRDWGRRTKLRKRWRIWLQEDASDGAGIDPIQLLADPRGELPEDTLDNQAAMRRVLRTIKTLPTRQREALLLRVWEGMNVAETAKAMGCTSGSVKTHLFRGLSKLRETLDIER